MRLALALRSDSLGLGLFTFQEGILAEVCEQDAQEIAACYSNTDFVA